MRFLLSRRWILFFGAVALMAFLAFRLGEWQFDRLEDREQRNQATARNLAAEAVPVEAVLAVEDPVAAQDEWRHVTASGVYDDEATVVVRYQTREGRSGVDVVTPLVTDSGAALLVNRGWLATENVGTTRPDVPPPPAGEVEVSGWVRADATGDSARVAEGSTRAISSRAIGATLPYPVYQGFVELDDQSPAADEPLEKVETPDLGEGPHFYYGLQWWFFAALAVFGFGYLAWDERRRLKRRPSGASRADRPSAPADGEAPDRHAARPRV